MPFPEKRAELMAAAAQVDTAIANLRPMLTRLTAAEADIRRELIATGKPLRDQLAGSVRLSSLAQSLIQPGPELTGKTLAGLAGQAYPVGL